MAKRKAKGDRPIGHRLYVRDPAKPPGCATCSETWPCKIWQRWTQTPEYRRAERETAATRADLARWKAGQWAADVAYGPACICGLARDGRDTCQRHPERNHA